MFFGDDFAGVPGSEGAILDPIALPFGFDEIEGILFSDARHRAGMMREAGVFGNGFNGWGVANAVGGRTACGGQK